MSGSARYDGVLREFLEGHGGMLVMLSDDALFVRATRTVAYKILAVKTDCLHVTQDQALALKHVRDLLTRGFPVLVLADRMLRGRSTLDFLRGVKAAFGEAKLLVMTQETTKDELSQLYEIGVDSVLTKPVSIDTLVEKMAGAIRPQGRISQLVTEARRILNQGDTARAMDLARAILALKESSAVAHILLGDALLREGRREEAVREFEAAHGAAKLYLEPLKRLAEVHRDEDDAEYLRCLRKLDSISPLNTERKCEIGKTYAKKGDKERADQYFSAAIANARREAMHHVERVVTDIAEHMAEASPDLAEKYYAQLLELKGDNLSPEDIATFNRLGIALRRQGKWREAVENYKRALAVAPEDERVLYNMGLAYADGQLHRMAVGAFEQVLRLNPGFPGTAPVVAYSMANAYAQARDTDMARHLLGSALEQEPGHAPSLRLKARLDAEAEQA